jgi:hypothetical protein
MRAVDVNATIGPEGAEIKLPRLSVVVEVAQARRLRDKLNAVLPEAITDLVHEPRVKDVDVLKAAQALLAERGQDTESIAVMIDSVERNADPPRRGDRIRDPIDGKHRTVAKVTGHAVVFTDGATMGIAEAVHGERTDEHHYLLCLWGDVDPQVCGPYRDDKERLEAAQDSRRAHGESNGLFRVDVHGSRVTASSFTGSELEMPESPEADDDDQCRECGEQTNLDGYDGLCGNCADRAENTKRCEFCNAADAVIDSPWLYKPACVECAEEARSALEQDVLALAFGKDAKPALTNDGRRIVWVSNVWINGRNATVAQISDTGGWHMDAYENDRAAGEPVCVAQGLFDEREDALEAGNQWARDRVLDLSKARRTNYGQPPKLLTEGDE